MNNFDLKKYLTENKLLKETIGLNESLFGTSFEKEKRKLEDALDRWVKYSMENGDSEADVLSAGQEYLKDAIMVYVGGKSDSYKTLDRYDKIKKNL